ncbi:MAG: formyltetrahydrofolate deformylase [Aquisalinus sp.]|nr:formyltetrahydrofolate deformylase [Aquisalinus sp.]
MSEQDYILKIRSPDRPGILAEVSTFLSSQGADIRDASQYGDPESGTFFIRIHLVSPAASYDQLCAKFGPVAEKREFVWALHPAHRKSRVLLAVSKHGHCLVDLLHRWRIDALPIDLVGVVSNHKVMEDITKAYDLPFHHLPVTPETKPTQEAHFRQLIEDSDADLVVLARYMQILSDEFARWLEGRCINIHHSFLPSFKGARPYHQAYSRGVKLIGATAHYVTPDLDEGPIIEQDVKRVTHAQTPEQLVSIGRDVESQVLARAIRWHTEHRVFISGRKTVVLA